MSILFAVHLFSFIFNWRVKTSDLSSPQFEILESLTLKEKSKYVTIQYKSVHKWANMGKHQHELLVCLGTVIVDDTFRVSFGKVTFLNANQKSSSAMKLLYWNSSFCIKANEVAASKQMPLLSKQSWGAKCSLCYKSPFFLASLWIITQNNLW